MTSSRPARLSGPLLALAALLTAAASALPATAGATPASGAASFRVKGDLVAVAAASASSAWAVGYAGTALRPSPLIVAWDGTSWRRQRAPAPAGSTLTGVAAISARSAWAVGSTGTGQTLILHWSGTSWKHTPSPSPGKTAALDGVSAVSATDAWAVGTASSGSHSQTLILRWNGHIWQRVPSPNPAGAFLAAVAAASGRSAWAVGVAGNPALSRTLALRWNGTAWARVPSPSLKSEPSVFRAVAADPAGGAWAVGCTACATASGLNMPLIARWHRSAWRKVAARGLGAPGGILAGVAGTSASSAWAVGCTESGAGTSETLRTLIARWNGRTWRRVVSPSPGPDAALLDVAAVSARDAWAVGNSGHATFSTLILHWNGRVWR